jgi:RNA polymerase sigma factor (sigma-70 family)
MGFGGLTGMNENEIQAGIDIGIKALLQVSGSEHTNIIEPIVRQNYEKKRIHKFLDKKQIKNSEQYVWRVSRYYEEYDPYWSKIKAQDALVWQDLVVKLERWARFYTQKAGCFVAWSDCAQSSAISILQSSFPFDTSFDPWARIIARNNCYEFANQYNLIGDHEVSDSDLLETVAKDFDKNDYSDLLDAIEALCTDYRQMFILLKYFEDLTFKEISSKMGKSVGALYKLHFDTLQELREILSGE